MPAKVTLQDVADRANVHRTTVSLALRDNPRIPEPTRRRIQAIAKKLGYSINPLVAALMQSRRTGKPLRHEVIAYVTAHPTRYGWRPPYHDRPDFFPGAVARAKDLGYKIEHFWLAEPGMTPDRFSDILSARGIHGLLIGRLPRVVDKLELAWERFSCVALGVTLNSPKLHRVTEHHVDTVWQAMEQCRQRGYRRVGLVYATERDSLVYEYWGAGFFSKQSIFAPEDKIPPYEEDYHDGPAFIRWFERWKPDAILITRADPILKWLKMMGKEVPHDVGVVEITNERPHMGHAGMHYPPSKLGALGVEMLVGLMHRGERGVPSNAHEIFMAGEWLEGHTLPPRI